MTYDVIMFTDVAAQYGHIKPLGAYRLASELRAHGYSVKVIDYTGKIMLDKDLFCSLLDGLIGPNTLFLGWSSTFFGDYSLLDQEDHMTGTFAFKSLPYPVPEKSFVLWLKYINKKFPHVKNVYGGAYAVEKRSLINELDYVVVGLADKSVVDLANHLKNKTPIQYRPSLTHRWKIIDHDHLGAGFDFKNCRTRYEPTDHVVPGEVLVLETSRGCMFKCKFCSYPLLGRKKTDPAYHKSHQCLADELRYNWDCFGVKKYVIVDDTFNETTSKLESVLRAKDQAGIDLEFTSYIRIDLVARFPEQIALLRDLGLKGAFFGIESFNDASATAIGKGIPSNRVKEILYKIKAELGTSFNSTVSLIGGLPHETPESLARDMEWVMSHDSPIDSYTLKALHITPNDTWPSEFAINYRDYGYQLSHDGYWQNKIWDQHQVQALANQYQTHGFVSGKLKMPNFSLFYMSAYGYDLADIQNVPLKDLDWNQFKKDFDTAYSKYIQAILKFEHINTTWKQS
jgi:hypothetical protein